MNAQKKDKPSGWRWTYVGITGPFQIISPSGHVVVTIHGVSADPSKDIPLVAKLTNACQKHAALTKESP